MDFVAHLEGYVKAVHTGSTTEYHYVYNYTDHLGNNRLSYGRDPETNEVAILKESHYYPFGLQHNGYVGTHRTTGIIEEIGGGNRVGLIPVRNYLDDSYRYTFGGKEEQPELGLNWIDHHARNYDAVLGRWMSVDPLADIMPAWSPYRYGFNNPLVYADPTGLFETRAEARSYRKEHNIKGRIQKGSDGSFAINNRKEGYSYHRDSEAYSDLGTSSDGVIKSVFLTSSSSKGVQNGIPIWGFGTEDNGHKNGTKRGSIDMKNMPFSGATGAKTNRFMELVRYLLDGLGIYNNVPEPSSNKQNNSVVESNTITTEKPRKASSSKPVTTQFWITTEKGSPHVIRTINYKNMEEAKNNTLYHKSKGKTVNDITIDSITIY